MYTKLARKIEGVRVLWLPRWYFETQVRKTNELERRVKRLELICLMDAKSKIASLRDEKAGTSAKDGILTIEEIINQSTNTR